MKNDELSNDEALQYIEAMLIEKNMPALSERVQKIRMENANLSAGWKKVDVAYCGDGVKGDKTINLNQNLEQRGHISAEFFTRGVFVNGERMPDPAYEYSDFEFLARTKRGDQRILISKLPSQNEPMPFVVFRDMTTDEIARLSVLKPTDTEIERPVETNFWSNAKIICEGSMLSVPGYMLYASEEKPIDIMAVTRGMCK